MEKSGKQIMGHRCCKRKTTEQSNPDRLSELPEPLIIQILSSLEMKHAVTTGLLSKRWKHLWTQVYNIVFDFRDTPYDENITSFIDHTLMQCTHPNIEKFALKGLAGYFMKDKCVHQLVDKWVQFVLKKNVKFLSLEVDFFVSYCLYCYSSLIKLKLQRMLIHLYSSPVNWPLLKNLSLCDLQVDYSTMQNILLGCSALETLVLDDVRGLHHYKIMSRSVKTLKLLNIKLLISDSHPVEAGLLKITAPYIRTLVIGGVFLVRKCQLVDVSSLESATLNFEWVKRTVNYYHFSHSYIGKEYWTNMVMELLKAMRKVDGLRIGTQIIQALLASKLLHKPYPVFKCKYLTIWSPLCEYDVYGIAYLLQNTPYLETLYIKATYWQTLNIMSYTHELGRNRQLSMPKGSLRHLKNVKIEYIRGWCEKIYYDEVLPMEREWGTVIDTTFACSEKNNLDLDHLLVEYILKNASVLNKLVILSSAHDCTDRLTECSSRFVHRLYSCLLKSFQGEEFKTHLELRFPHEPF